MVEMLARSAGEEAEGGSEECIVGRMDILESGSLLVRHDGFGFVRLKFVLCILK